MIDNYKVAIEILSDEYQFEKVETEWDGLLEASTQRSAFYRHGWLMAAWQWCKDDADLSVVLVTRNGVAVAACPLIRKTSNIAGVPMRALEYLSIPDTQQCDIICIPGMEHDVAVHLADWLIKLPNWDLIRLDHLPPDSFFTTRLFPQFRSANLSISVEAENTNLMIPLVGTWEEYFGRRSRRFRSGLNLSANRISKRFDNVVVQVMRLSQASVTEKRAIERDLVETSTKSWKHAMTDTGFAAPGPKAFLKRLLAAETMAEHILVWRLMLDSECVATELQLVQDGVVSALRSDFDSEHDKVSPGSYLNMELLKKLLDDQVSEYRMGPGMNAYKKRWAEGEIELSSAMVYAKSFKGHIAQLYTERLRPTLADFRSKFRGL